MARCTPRRDESQREHLLSRLRAYLEHGLPFGLAHYRQAQSTTEPGLAPERMRASMVAASVAGAAPPAHHLCRRWMSIERVCAEAITRANRRIR